MVQHVIGKIRSFFCLSGVPIVNSEANLHMQLAVRLRLVVHLKLVVHIQAVSRFV